VNVNQPLSESELQELGDFLESDAVPLDAMDIGTLDGFLTSVAIGPEFVLPSEWLPRVFGESEAPHFSSLGEAKRVTDLIMRFYNQIVLTFEDKPDDFLPLLYDYEEDGKLKTSAEEWCIGFSLGVHLRTKAWEPLMKDQDFSELLSPIVAFSYPAAWEEVVAGHGADEVREMLVAILPDAVKAIHHYWQLEREEDKNKGRGAVTKNTPLGGGAKRRREAPSTGRSGKKSKRCSGRPAKR
jgi:uncharacterized protein